MQLNMVIDYTFAENWSNFNVNENNSYGTRSHKINVYFFRFDAIHKIHSLYAILSNVSFLKEGNPIVKENYTREKMEYAKNKASLVYF